VNPAPAAPPAFIDESYDPAEAEMVVFKGWARMACAVLSLEITEVKRPKLGEMVSHHFNYWHYTLLFWAKDWRCCLVLLRLSSALS
jgi:hypothetical protein